MEVRLGQMGRDKITGYEGIVMAKSQYLTGCDMILLAPVTLDKEGKRKEGEWFDDVRVEPIGTSVLELRKPTAAPVEKPGRDERNAPAR